VLESNIDLRLTFGLENASLLTRLLPYTCHWMLQIIAPKSLFDAIVVGSGATGGWAAKELTEAGMRVALLIGGLTSLVVIPIALLFGVTAGYFGRRIDAAVFFAMTVLASVPSLLLLIALIMALGKGTVQVCVALGVTGWVHFCRIARGETLKLREADFVAAARALGVREGTIIRRHILPNIAHLVIITFALSFTALVLSETILSYLGIGLDGSWGQMIDQARNELSRTPIIWWNLAGASIALFTLVLSVNMIADAMRDIIDPRTRREGR